MDFAVRRDAEEPEAETPAQVAETRIALAPLAAARKPRGEPDFVAHPGPVDALQHEVEGERQLQLADDNDRRIALAEADEIAAADFAFDGIAEAFQMALDRKIKGGFQ